MRSAARASMGGRHAWEEEPAGVSDGVVIRLQRIYNFDCSMLYYLLFWAILGFIIHFYGTNLLTGGPAQICCFIPISVF